MRFKPLIVLLLALSASVTSNAQSIIYVNASTGDDATGTGSSTLPFKTFHKGYTEASAGDILDLNGTFTWSDVDESGDAATTGYTIAKNLTVRGQTAASTIIQAETTENTADRRVFTINAGVSVILVDLTIRHGQANTGTNFDGGGGIKNSGKLYMDGCVVTKNRIHTSTYQHGGGILITGSDTTTVVNSTFKENTSSGSQGVGSAIAHGNYTGAPTLDLKNSTIHNNTGGNGVLSFTFCSPVNKVTNCTFFGNTATRIIYVDRSNLIMTNCTLAHNTGNGLLVYGTTRTLYFKNNLFANNSGTDFIFDRATVVNGGYNLVETASGYTFSGTGDITGDQANLNLSASLADNSTQSGSQTLALQANSVAINAGNATPHGPSGNKVSASYDQRLFSRNGTTDIGAYEYDGTISYAWSGGVSSEWTTAANWRNKQVPSGSFNLIMHPVVIYNDLVLDQDRTVQRLDLNQAKHLVRLGNHHITASDYVNANTTSYVQTNGTGTAKINITNGAGKMLPVGNSSYNPLTITNNTGASDDFSARILDGVFTGGLSGNAVTSAHVQRTWDIGKSGPNGGSGVDLIFQWNTNEESAPITAKALFHFDGTWQKQTGATSSTSSTLTYTGYTGSFSPFAIAEGSSALPVSWLSFTGVAQQGKVGLTWKTAQEQNTRDFIIEHSTDNIQWTVIGSNAAAGNSATETIYHYMHLHPLTGSNYYRLLQRDQDASQSYSKTIHIQLTQSTQQVSIFPNPVLNGQLKVNLKTKSSLRIINASGVEVLRKELPQGLHSLPLGHLPKGHYFMKTPAEMIPFIIQ